MEKWIEILIPILIAEIIGLGGLIWKLASVYGSLKQADSDNKRDINNLGKKVNRIDSITWKRIDNIEDFLENTSSFKRKSINLFDDKN